MSPVPAESVALHLIRHLVRGLGKTEGQGDLHPKPPTLVDGELGAAWR